MKKRIFTKRLLANASLVVILCGMAACSDEERIEHRYYKTNIEGTQELIVLDRYTFSYCRVAPNGDKYEIRVVVTKLYDTEVGKKYELTHSTAVKVNDEEHQVVLYNEDDVDNPRKGYITLVDRINGYIYLALTPNEFESLLVPYNGI